MITGLRSSRIMWIASLAGLSASSSGSGGSITSVTGSPRIPGWSAEAISRPRSLTVPMKARPSSPETTGTCETPCSRISSSA